MRQVRSTGWDASRGSRVWGQKIAKRSGFKKARVALARKMAVVLHRMWLSETDFGAHTVNAE